MPDEHVKLSSNMEDYSIKKIGPIINEWRKGSMTVEKNKVTVKDILKEAFASEDVTVTDQEVKKNEKNLFYYYENTCSRSENQYHIQSNNKIDKFWNMKQSIKKSAKTFMFLRLEKELPDYLLSIELEYFFDNNARKIGTITLWNGSSLKDEIEKYPYEKIIRLEPTGKDGYKFHLVFIKLRDDKGQDDYSALRDYVVSSDSRTYNKVIRNLIEYIEVEKKEQLPQNQSDLPHNLLVSGAPGTGKSYFINKSVINAGESIIDQAINELVSQQGIDPGDEAKMKMVKESAEKSAKKEYTDKYVTRVTFYEDYSYENFIGCYKPVPTIGETEFEYNGCDGSLKEERITYSYVSGPFIDTYMKAMKDEEHNYFLIIEEINRAKAASVFGDMFQLLDREKGVSEYDIKPEAALSSYLKEMLGDKYNGFMRLPSNMYIWATMNSADQGVMPLDSAFKRRWSSLYMDINDEKGECKYTLVLPRPDKTLGLNYSRDIA